MDLLGIRNTLLGLDDYERMERRRAFSNYLFYCGKSKNLGLAKKDPIWYGQNWPINDNLDYTPTQDIRNKTKHLLKKQARFMFSNIPTLVIKPDNVEDKEETENLRRFLEDIFEDNQFWKNTRKAFLEATIEQRVLLRIEANPGEPIKLKYEPIQNFSYKDNDGSLMEVRIFESAPQNVLYTDDDARRVFYLHLYSHKQDEQGNLLPNIIYTKTKYTNNDFENPADIQIVDTGFTSMPCWLIVNGGELGNKFGESDVTDLKKLQTLYNKKNSDFADALRFQMFGALAIVDGKDEDVNQLQIRPNAIHAIRTRDEANDTSKQASITREEYSMSNATAVESYLSRMDKDMRDIMDMPDIVDLVNIPSAKAMRYLYNDLIARCEEKWSDWQPIFLQMINFILTIAPSLKSYTNFNKAWLGLKYTLYFQHNYPIPDDIDTKKQTAMQEVIDDVRSISSYIKEFSNEEDANAEFNRILYEKAMITSVESGNTIPELDENGNLIEPLTTTSTTEPPITTNTSTASEGDISGDGTSGGE